MIANDGRDRAFAQTDAKAFIYQWIIHTRLEMYLGRPPSRARSLPYEIDEHQHRELVSVSAALARHPGQLMADAGLAFPVIDPDALPGTIERYQPRRFLERDIETCRLHENFAEQSEARDMRLCGGAKPQVLDPLGARIACQECEKLGERQQAFGIVEQGRWNVGFIEAPLDRRPDLREHVEKRHKRTDPHERNGTQATLPEIALNLPFCREMTSGAQSRVICSRRDAPDRQSGSGALGPLQ